MQRLSGEEGGAVLKHLLKHHDALPAYDLIRTCVKRVTVYFDHLVIAFKLDGFKKLVDKHLRVSVTGCADEFEITVPFKTKRGRDGAMVIKGIAWRDEHFAGAYIKDIAARENYSDRYVRNRIMASFEI